MLTLYSLKLYKNWCLTCYTWPEAGKHHYVLSITDNWGHFEVGSVCLGSHSGLFLGALWMDRTGLSYFCISTGPPSVSPWRQTAAASRSCPPDRRSAQDRPAASSAGILNPFVFPSEPPGAPSSPAHSDRRNKVILILTDSEGRVTTADPDQCFTTINIILTRSPCM